MTIRTIIRSTEPESILYKYSKPVSDFGPALGQLVADMVDTMRAANGIGLAAPQIGELLRVFIISDSDTEHSVYINPRLLTHSAKLLGFNEGCLSVDEVPGAVVRPDSVEAIWYGVNGKRNGGRLIGLKARMFLHELDHLNGTLYTSRIKPGEFVIGDKPQPVRG